MDLPAFRPSRWQCLAGAVAGAARLPASVPLCFMATNQRTLVQLISVLCRTLALQGVHPGAALPLLWQRDGQPSGLRTWGHRSVPRRCCLDRFLCAALVASTHTGFPNICGSIMGSQQAPQPSH